MTTLFQSSDKNATFSKIGNGQFGNVIRSGWKPCKLGEAKKQIILQALDNSSIDKVYKRGNKIFALHLNGKEEQIG
jgi:hypothetical protein